MLLAWIIVAGASFRGYQLRHGKAVIIRHIPNGRRRWINRAFAPLRMIFCWHENNIRIGSEAIVRVRYQNASVVRSPFCYQRNCASFGECACKDQCSHPSDDYLCDVQFHLVNPFFSSKTLFSFTFHTQSLPDPCESYPPIRETWRTARKLPREPLHFLIERLCVSFLLLNAHITTRGQDIVLFGNRFQVRHGAESFDLPPISPLGRQRRFSRAWQCPPL